MDEGLEVPRPSEQEILKQKSIEEYRRIKSGEISEDEWIEKRLAEAADKAELEELTQIEPLTKLPNRRGFDNALKRVAAGIERTQRQAGAENFQPNIAFLRLDLDNFKQTNDRFGHPIGDKVLKEVAAILGQAARRGTDIVAREGGEELIIAVIEAPINDIEHTLNSAIFVAKRIQGLLMDAERKPETTLAQIAAAGKKQTASIGIAAGSGIDQLDELSQFADQALYDAKGQGRNRVGVFMGEGDIRIVDTVEPDLEGNPRNITYTNK